MSKKIPVIADSELTIHGHPYDPTEWEAKIERMAHDAHAKRRANLQPGGKSLSGDGAHSPVLQVRVPEQLRDQLKQRAEHEGISMSKLARRALEKYLRAS